MLAAANRGAAVDLISRLPPSASIRWFASQKAAVVIAIRHGTLTFTEACERYRLSHEELAAWEVAFDQDGMARAASEVRLHPVETERLNPVGTRFVNAAIISSANKSF